MITNSRKILANEPTPQCSKYFKMAWWLRRLTPHMLYKFAFYSDMEFTILRGEGREGRSRRRGRSRRQKKTIRKSGRAEDRRWGGEWKVTMTEGKGDRKWTLNKISWFLCCTGVKYGDINKRNFSERQLFYHSFKHYMFWPEADHPQVFQYKSLKNKGKKVNNLARSHKRCKNILQSACNSR
jgi:hypothetical protein